MRRTDRTRRRGCARMVLALCSASATACSGGDIVLGERGRPLDPAADGSTRAASDDTAPAALADGPSGRLAPRADAAVGGSPAVLPDAAAITAPDLAVRPSAGCGQDPPLERSVSIDGKRTDYLLDLPSNYDSQRAYPLLLAFRGMNVSTPQFRAQLGLPELLGSAAVVVHANPQNDAVAWDFQRDMQLVDALLAALATGACIDLDRIFAIGDGAGALFVNLLGCVRGSQVRGIALLSSAPPPPGPCVGSTAVWLLQQTDADQNLVGAGLGNRDFWASKNGCDVRSATSVGPPQCVEYAGCSPGLPVRYCEHTGTALPSFAASASWELFRAL